MSARAEPTREGRGKTALVTGGTQGIGFATATKLAERGFHVVLTGRAQASCDEKARQIASRLSGSEVAGMELDLASLKSVREFAAAFLAKGWSLELLVNNAGQMSVDQSRHTSADGIESTMAINVIGPFLLTNLLLPALERSRPARVINVSSRLHLPGSHGSEVRWDWDDVNGEKSFDPMVAYKNSKLAMMWFTYELNRRVQGKGITVNAVCPGFVPSTIAEHRHGMDRFIYQHVMPHVPGTHTVEQGADNTIFVSTNPIFASKGGVFVYEEKEIPSSEESRDSAKAARFWSMAAGLTGIEG
jgi:NAD(P)-dependent dehydrogenase (short-subunit alcohol dehydrogenase family)